MALPNCTSWQQPGGTILCESDPDAGWPYPIPAAAIPRSPSKCNCDNTFTLDVQVQDANITVTKTPTPTFLPEPGGDFSYSVVVTNNSSFGSVTINQICDDKFGNIATAVTTPTQPDCAAGTLCSTPNNVAGKTCATNITCPIGTLTNPNDSLTCTFTGNVTGTEQTVQDTVTVHAVDEANQPFSKTASATVTISDAPAKAQVTKSIDGDSQCATVRYKVKVDNTSGGGTDEVETLSVLNDSHYGDITKATGNVLGTTCGVATTAKGLGTLSTVLNGPGTLPATIAVGGSYTCEFDGQFCGALAAAGTGCTTGLEEKDTVTATLTGDETLDPSQDSASDELTVDVCFSTSETTK